MTDENYQRLENLVNELNTDSSLNLKLSKQCGCVGVALESNPRNWKNLDGYNLLGQLRIIIDLTKDIT